jgi:hypothetical protein
VQLPDWGIYRVNVTVNGHSMAVLPVRLMPLDALVDELGQRPRPPNMTFD